MTTMRFSLPLRPTTLLVGLFLGVLSSSPAQRSGASPDYVLLNGKIFVGAHQHFVQALAVKDERVIATGTSKRIIAMAGEKTTRIDLAGRTVIPGINDAHYHLFLSPELYDVPLKSMDPTWEEARPALEEAIRKTPQTEFVRVVIGGTILDDARVTRVELDRLAPDHAVILDGWTGHSAVLNTVALKKLGVSEEERDPVGGHYERGADGKLDGRVFEFARFQLHRRLSDLASHEEAVQETREFLQQAVRYGITTVQVMSLPPSVQQSVDVFESAPTTIRIRIMHFMLTDSQGPLRETVPVTSNNPLVRVSGTKWVLDGTPIERWSAMKEPYSDKHETSGQMDFGEPAMEAMLLHSLKDGDQFIAHVVGDRTTEEFLRALDATGGSKTWAGKRVRIEHGDGITPAQMEHVRQLGIVVVANPTHFSLGELMLKRMGAQRTKQNEPLRSMLDKNIVVAFGSDGPFNPYLNIMFATAYPGKPQEAVTREQAVTAYTQTSAYAEFAEKDKGTLEAGKLADLAVLSQDIFDIPAEQLPETQSVLTMVGGKVVYNTLAVK